jgi:hypothetical protein
MDILCFVSDQEKSGRFFDYEQRKYFPWEIRQSKRSTTSDIINFLHGLFSGGTFGRIFTGIIVRNSVSEFA